MGADGKGQAVGSDDWTPQLIQNNEIANRQIINSANRNVQTGVDQLNRALQDAQPKYQQAIASQILSTKQQMDNAALYAEQNGDRGGIGQAQWNSIANTGAKNLQAIGEEQRKLATDTARQIADLRAHGEFEKADALLSQAQTNFSNIYNEWQRQQTAKQNSTLSQIALSVLQNGGTLTPSMKEALGLTDEEIKAFQESLKVNGSSGTGKGAGQFVPTALNQFASTLRENRIGIRTNNIKSSFGRVVVKNIATILKKIPFAEDISEAIFGGDSPYYVYTDALGRTDSAGPLLLRIFDNFINPSYSGLVTEDDVIDELKSLREANGGKDVIPNTRSGKIRVWGDDGTAVDIKLNTAQWSMYDRTHGEMFSAMLSAALASDYYNTLTDQEKFDLVRDIDSIADEYGKYAAGVGYEIKDFSGGADQDLKLWSFIQNAGYSKPEDALIEAWFLNEQKKNLDADDSLTSTERKVMLLEYINKEFSTEQARVAAYNLISNSNTPAIGDYEATYEDKKAYKQLYAEYSESVFKDILKSGTFVNGDNATKADVIAAASSMVQFYAKRSYATERNLSDENYDPAAASNKYDTLINGGLTFDSAFALVKYDNDVKNLEEIDSDERKRRRMEYVFNTFSGESLKTAYKYLFKTTSAPTFDNHADNTDAEIEAYGSLKRDFALPAYYKLITSNDYKNAGAEDRIAMLDIVDNIVGYKTKRNWAYERGYASDDYDPATAENRYVKLQNAGIGYADMLRLKKKYDEINKSYDSATARAQAFASYVENDKVFKKNSELIRDTMSYWQMMRANTSTYDKFSSNYGFTPEEALKASEALQSLEPDADHAAVTDSQRITCIAGMNWLSESKKYTALRSYYENNEDDDYDAYDAIVAAENAGIPAQSYVDYINAIGAFKSDKDKDGKTISKSKQNKIKAYISGLNIEDSWKDILWMKACHSNRYTYKSGGWR